MSNLITDCVHFAGWGAKVRAERHQPDYILMITVLMLTGIGIVTVYSASMVYDLHHGLSPDHYAIRQLFAAIVGLLAFAGLTFVPYEFWYRNAPKALAVSIFLLVVVMLPGVGHRSQGATRWIGSSSFHVQPSEIALVAVIIYLAFLLTKKLPVIHNTSRAFRPAIVVVFWRPFSFSQNRTWVRRWLCLDRQSYCCSPPGSESVRLSLHSASRWPSPISQGTFPIGQAA